MDDILPSHKRVSKDNHVTSFQGTKETKIIAVEEQHVVFWFDHNLDLVIELKINLGIS